MKNVFFPDEDIDTDDLFFMCSMIERIARRQKQTNAYLILSTLSSGEDYADGMLRIYNDKICKIIDNYNGSAYYEPSYVLARSYYNGVFN